VERRPNVGAQATCGRKETCSKRRKSNMKEENKHVVKAGKPNHDRVRVFDKDCNIYKPINSINKQLESLGGRCQLRMLIIFMRLIVRGLVEEFGKVYFEG
jgi:hypothetical protein